MKLRYILPVAAAALCATSQAQTITFDTEDYASVGVYDTWEDSPFRTGELTGNCAVIPNFLGEPDENGASADTTKNILAVQRSRFGSNTFGARIDLKEPFELTSTAKYVQVLIYTPKQSRVMLIGLGKRRDRAGQSKEVVQFNALAQGSITAGQWSDAIFTIQGHGGIDIYSLVVVPDLESTHDLSADFAAYIDEILITSSPELRVKSGNYPINVEESSVSTRSDRGIRAVGLGTQSITVQTSIATGQPIYYQRLTDEFQAKAGETLSPSFTYTGSWMSGYTYVDWGMDGSFSFDIDTVSHKALAGSDLVSYSYYKGYNSAGETKSNGNTLDMPTFTVPDTIANGFYRMRYKVDWDYIDAGGNGTSTNNIISNGGGFVDTRLNIHGDTIVVSDNQLNGEVLAQDGSKLNNYRHPFGQALTVRVAPENGFSYNGIRVRHGHNLGGDSLIHGTPQYVDVTFTRDQFNDNDEFTIPAQYVDGDINIYGLIVEKGKETRYVDVTYNLVWDGNVRESATKTLATGTQAADSIPTFSDLPDFVVVSSADSIVIAGEDTVNVYATWEGPFLIGNTYGDAYWYNLVLRNAYYPVYAATSTPNVTLTTTYNEEDENAAWAFLGNPFDGFTIVNLAAGPDVVFRAASAASDGNTGGSTYPVLSADATTYPHAIWKIKTSTYVSDGFYIEDEEGIALNYRNPNLAFWTGGRGIGSTFYVLDTGFLPTGISQAATAGSQNGLTYDLSGRRLTGRLSRGLYIVDGRKILVK